MLRVLRWSGFAVFWFGIETFMDIRRDPVVNWSIWFGIILVAVFAGASSARSILRLNQSKLKRSTSILLMLLSVGSIGVALVLNHYRILVWNMAYLSSALAISSGVTFVASLISENRNNVRIFMGIEGLVVVPKGGPR